jgi:putative colanic acid biosynthesis glycosyltransferase
VAFFSIITVCLNNLDGLKKTAASLAAQDFRDFEWLVMDGGSTDGTPEFLKSTHAFWLSEPDNGIYDAMNKGIEKSAGEYLLFLNAGDALAYPDILTFIHESASEKPTLIYGDSLEQDEQEYPTYKPARKTESIAMGLFTHHQAIFYNHIALGSLRYNTAYKIAADYDLTARMLQKNGTVLYVEHPICIFESGGVSQQKAAQGRQEQFEIRKNLRMCNPLKNSIIRAGQALIWTFRSAFPNLYWSLKSR